MTFFFYGTNVYALRQQVGKMMTEYRKRTGSDFGLERVDGATIKPRDLVSTLQAAPFLATSRMVVVEGLSANKITFKVSEVLANIPTSTVAVFVDPAVDRRTTTYKDLLSADKAIEFKPLGPPQLLAWASSLVKELGGTADRAALMLLMDLVGDDQWRLNEEIGKLVNFRTEVSIETVRELVVAGVEQSIFELVDAMTAGKTAEALTAYRNLLDRRENELYILTMIQWQMRNLLWAVNAPDGITQAELAKAAGLSPYVAGKALSARKRQSASAVRAAYIAASEAEFDIKTGRTKAEAAVEQVIFRVSEIVTSKA